MRIKFLILFLFNIIGVFSQISMSPISMSENGKIYDDCGGKSIGLAGTGIANIDKNLINFLNPAAYANIDSQIFIFNICTFATFLKYHSTNNSGFSSNFNINSVSLSFKVSRNIGLSMGILPFNYVGYDINAKINQQGFLKEFEKNYKGEGGINNFFLGISIKLSKDVSGGFDFCYLNGNVKLEEIVSETEFLKMYYKASKITYYNGFYISPGIIYNPSFNKKLFIGLKYTPSIVLNGNLNYFLVMNDYDTLTYNDENKIKNKIFDKLGLGIAYKGEKLNLLSDIVKSDLFNFSNKTYKFSVGVEYKNNNNFYKKNFSILSGFSYEILSEKFLEKNIYKYNFTLGCWLPINKNSLIFSLEAGKYGLLNSSFLKEYYTTLKIFVSLSEKWFEKRKYY